MTTVLWNQDVPIAMTSVTLPAGIALKTSDNTTFTATGSTGVIELRVAVTMTYVAPDMGQWYKTYVSRLDASGKVRTAFEKSCVNVAGDTMTVNTVLALVNNETFQINVVSNQVPDNTVSSATLTVVNAFS